MRLGWCVLGKTAAAMAGGLRYQGGMEKTHPNTPPLTEAELSLLASVRPRLHQRVLEGGLTPEEMGRLMRGLRHNPQLGAALLDMLQEEVQGMNLGSGGLNLRWD